MLINHFYFFNFVIKYTYKIEEGVSVDKLKKLKKRKRNLKFILLLVIVLLGYITYLFLNSPKIELIKYIQEFNGYQKIINTEYSNLFNNQKLGFKLNNTITLKDSFNLTSDITPINLNIEYAEDNTTKENYLNLTSSIKNKRFINLLSINKNNKLYYTLNNIYDNYYYLDSNFASLFKNKTVDKNIKDAIRNTVFKYIKNENFSRTSSNDTLNENEVTLTKTSLSLYAYQIKSILSNFKSELSPKNSGGKYNYILDNIDELTENIDSNDNTRYIYSLYKSDNGIVKQDLQIINNENEANIVFAYYDYDNKKEIKVTNNEENIIDVITATAGDETQITGNIGTNYNIDGKIDEDKILITIEDTDEVNVIKINGDITSKEIKENVTYNKNYDIEITYSINNRNVFFSSIKSDLTLTSDTEIKQIDVDEATSASEITEEDSNNLVEDLSRHDFIKNIGNLINNNINE